jgi:sec-independent protein translocase protein TatA
MSLGFWEVAILLLILLIIFGAGRLPRVAEDVAKTVRNFRSGLKDGPGGEAAESAPSPPAGPPRQLAGPVAGQGTRDEDPLAR